MVYFQDDGHKYFDEQKKPYESVSRVVDEFKDKFYGPDTAIKRALRDRDEDLYKACKKLFRWDDPEIISMVMLFINTFSDDVKEDILKKAEDYNEAWGNKGMSSAEDGTERHLEKEHEAMKRGFIINPYTGAKHFVIPRPSGDGFDNRYILEEVLSTTKQNVAILECLLKDDVSETAGQSDFILYSYLGRSHWYSKWLAYIGDYKTDAEITFDSFFDGKSYRKFKSILNYFKTCKIHYYGIKMSFYAYFLQLIDIPTQKMYLQNLRENNKIIHYDTGIYINYIPMIIEEFQKKRSSHSENNEDMLDICKHEQTN